jgi:predicted RNase H-like nuclease (RuvC/YqgF family)
MDESSIDLLLKCKICAKPFIDPVITRDGKRFCRICISEKSRLQNTFEDNQVSSFVEDLIPIRERLLLEMLDNLLVKCPKCPKLNIRRIDSEEHQNHECPKRIIPCKATDLKCPWVGAYEELDNHMKTCIFQLLRPILSQTLQYQTYHDKQNNEIEQLKTRIEQYENRTEKVQKGFKVVLEMTIQQKTRFDAFRKELDEQSISRDQLQNEVQQLREQYNQLHSLSNEFQTELHELNQLGQTINQDKELSKQTTQSNNNQNEFEQLKEQLNQQTIQFNQSQLEVKQLKEKYLNHDAHIRQLQQQDQSRKDDVIRIKQLYSKQEIHIHLLARRKCVIPGKYIDPFIKKIFFQARVSLHGYISVYSLERVVLLYNNSLCIFSFSHEHIYRCKD